MKLTFKKTAFAVGISTAMLGASLANAKDWSGAYVGATLGNNTAEGKANGYYGDFSGKDSDIGYGLTAGYNLQNGSSVYGVEADLNMGNINQGNDGYSISSYYEETEWNWYSTIRGRAGLAVDNTLLYVTAGLAIVDTDYQYCDNGSHACNDGDLDNASASGIEYGVAFGGGIEMALDDNLSIKGEIMHVDLDDVTEDRDGSAGWGWSYPVNFSSSLTTVRIGANYKF